MRLLQRPPETPSLETWLSRDVPHERELQQELLAKLGREQAVEALLQIYDCEEAKREKLRVMRFHRAIVLGVAFLLVSIAGAPWLHLMPFVYWRIAQATLLGFVVVLHLTDLIRPYHKIAQRQNNTVIALLAYAENPRVADALCRVLPHYPSADANDRWILHRKIANLLPRLPSDKDTLTKNARAGLWDCLAVMETAGVPDITSEQETDRAFYADFQMAVLHYLARTQDKDALPAIRKLAQAKTYSNDGARVRDAARDALQAFGESAA